jgi:hypothetical protein
MSVGLAAVVGKAGTATDTAPSEWALITFLGLAVLATLLTEADLGWKKPFKLCWPLAEGADPFEPMLDALASDFCFFAGAGFVVDVALRFLSGPTVSLLEALVDVNGSGVCGGTTKESNVSSPSVLMW